MPGDDLDAAAAALEAAVRGAAIAPEVELAFAYPAGRDHRLGGTPVETPAALPPVQLLQAAVRSVRPDRGEIDGAPYWSEAPFFVDPARRARGLLRARRHLELPHLEEHVELEEFYAGVVALAAFIAAFGRPSA